MRRDFFWFVFSIISGLLLQGCVTFKDGLKNPNPLSEQVIKSLNGIYQVRDKESDSVKSNVFWAYNDFFNEIDRKLIKDTAAFDTLSTKKFKLEILNKKRLQINYIKNENIVRTRIIKVRLEADGYLYLKNKNVGFILIPFLAGAIDVKQTRMTLNGEGDLLFDVANYRGGAFFFFIFLSWQNSSYRKTYARVYQE
ncbi:MAG: hypothetical protein ABL872_19610 [Lacibacter sp.]